MGVSAIEIYYLRACEKNMNFKIYTKSSPPFSGDYTSPYKLEYKIRSVSVTTEVKTFLLSINYAECYRVMDFEKYSMDLGQVPQLKYRYMPKWDITYAWKHDSHCMDTISTVMAVNCDV